jgi:hypothetical protein
MARRIAVLWVLLTAAALSQTFNARLTGSVRDTSEAVVPNATVTATQLTTNVKRTASTNSAGIYDIPLLLPGAYEIRVEAPGLQTQVRREVRLEVNQTATLDFQLGVAQVSTSVEVTAAIPLLQSETSGVGTTIENKLLEQYPLIERDVMGVVRSLPGVISSGNVGQARQSRNVFDANFSVAGGRASTNEMLIDGAVNTTADMNGVIIVPAVDSVQEFRMETSSYSAEFGRSGGGTVNIVTKAGTNQFHGGTYYYHQNTAFNANSFTNNRLGLTRAIVRRNQYGGTLGGPIWLPKIYRGTNRTFFFFSFEGRREHDPIQGLYSIPTAREMAGDFSQTFVFVGAQPQLVQIFDPATSRTVGGRRTRDPFPGNTVPSGRQNSIAKRVLQEYPQPNRPGDPITNRRNYYYEDIQRYSRDLIGGRVDHFFKEMHRLFVRFNWQENLVKNPPTVVNFANPTSNLDNYRNAGLDDTYQITPHLSNVFRYAYTRFRPNNYPTSLMGYDPTNLGLPAYLRDSANILFYPNFDFGFVKVGGAWYNNQPTDTQGFQNMVLWVGRGHDLRVGAEYRLYRHSPFQIFDPTGSFSFGTNFTQQDHLAAYKPVEGMGLASFLLGTGDFQFEHREPLRGFNHYAGAFVQDDWKITSRLTLNLGLRWDLETGTAESRDRLTYFDPSASNPLQSGLKGAVIFAGKGNPRSVREPNWRNFGPRAGFAYRIAQRMSVRGAYGIMYLPVPLMPSLVSTPFSYAIKTDNLNPDYTPKSSVSDPFPGGIVKPAAANRVDDGSFMLGNFVNTTLRNQKMSYIQQWNFGISRQLRRSMVLDATYYGSRGVHLVIPSLEINQVDPVYLAKGPAYLLEPVANPFYGKITSGLLSLPRVPRLQLLKPFPQYAYPTTAHAFGPSVMYFGPPAGDSVYHAVTFKLERRFSAGLSLSAHYTISKLIDTSGVGNGAAFTDPWFMRDTYNIRLERSVSAWDVPQRLIVNYAYELPFGRGKHWLNQGGPIGRLAEGWTVFSVHTFQSGQPISIAGPNRMYLGVAPSSNANVVAGQQPKISIDQARRNARDYDPIRNMTKPWFNTAAFTVAPEFTVPTAGRLVPNVRVDDTHKWDLSLTKRMRISERLSLILSGNAFNLLNEVHFGTPNTSVVSQNFGSVLSTSGPRVVELGAKVSF